VSVRVVRDALRILGSQGVIETSQGRRAVVADRPSAAIEGYFKFVTTSDDRAIAELFEVRTALETRAAGLAAGQASGDEISAIAEALAAMRAASDRIDAYAEADLAWHSAVVRGSHNRFLIGIHAALAEVLRSERIGGVTMRFRAGDPATKTLDEHAAITHAIANGDGASAQGLMLDHLERARQLYATYLASRDSLRRGSEQRR
jgi:GntR family transcriptional repressor for pyruvate dehydrogenase complex